jgi:hypothetical protein
MAENTMKSRLRDALAVALFFPALPFLRFVGPRRTYLHAVRGLLDRAGVTVMANHYYEPSYTAADIFRDPDEPRTLAGIDWIRTAPSFLRSKVAAIADGPSTTTTAGSGAATPRRSTR